MLADGRQTSTVTVTLRDQFNNPASGQTPTFDADGSGLRYGGGCTTSDSSGVSTCTNALSSTVVQSSTLRITSPVTRSGDAVDFIDTPSLPAGYNSRACGLDMNRNGIIGEPEDCNVCDGVTTDPDGDGVDEDLWYVDGTNGSNSNTGTPSSPLLTVEEALSRADGAADGAEDIFCLRGTIQEQIDVGVDGVGGYYERDGVQLPLDPSMFVGWDTDNDAEYPPFDPDDDVLLLGNDGTGVGNRRGFKVTDHFASYVEIAHLRAEKFDLQGTDKWRFYDLWAYGTENVSHHYVHDIEALDIAQGFDDDDEAGAILLGGDAPATIRHMVFSNIELTDVGGTVVTLYPDDSINEVQRVRVEHVTATFSGAGGQDTYFLFAVGVTGLEILNNVIDGQPASFDADETGGVTIADCTYDVLIQGNRMTDLLQPMVFEGNWFGCNEQPMGNITIDRNTILAESYWGDGTVPNVWTHIQVHSGHASPLWRNTGDFIITNNVMACTDSTRADSGIYAEIGNDEQPQDSRLIVAGNTFVTTVYETLVVLRDGHPNAIDEVYYLNNVQLDSSDNWTIYTDYDLDRWVSDGNVFSEFRFDYNDSSTNFTDYKNTTGQDGSSVICDTTFAAGDTFPLDAADACATGVGVDITNFATFVDIEGDKRAASAPQAGANVPAGQGDVLLDEHFTRLDSSVLGYGWVESDGPGGWDLASELRALTHFDGGSGSPMWAQRAFPEVNSGSIRWTFLGYLDADPDPNGWFVAMQLGDGEQMSSANADDGTAIDLRWGSTGAGFAQNARWGAMTSGGLIQSTATLDGDLFIVEVVADLDANTFDIDINGESLSSVGFHHDVPIDTLRIWVNGASGAKAFDGFRVEVP